MPFTSERHPVPEPAQRREGSEAAARRVRYAALEVFQLRIGDDGSLPRTTGTIRSKPFFCELLRGAVLAGLQGIHRRRGRFFGAHCSTWIGPSLDAFVAGRGVVPLDDPTNLDLAMDRNRIRHRIWLPHLEREEPGLGSALIAVAGAAERARRALDDRLERLLVKECDYSQPRLEVALLLCAGESPDWAERLPPCAAATDWRRETLSTTVRKAAA